MLKLSIDQNDYERFNSFFSEGRKNVVSKETFEELSNITTGGGDYSLYEVITFTNGEMLLIKYLFFLF